MGNRTVLGAAALTVGIMATAGWLAFRRLPPVEERFVFATRAKPLGELLKEFNAAFGTRLSASPELADRLVVLGVSDANVADVKERLAWALRGEWEYDVLHEDTEALERAAKQIESELMAEATQRLQSEELLDQLEAAGVSLDDYMRQRETIQPGAVTQRRFTGRMPTTQLGALIAAELGIDGLVSAPGFLSHDKTVELDKMGPEVRRARDRLIAFDGAVRSSLFKNKHEFELMESVSDWENVRYRLALHHDRERSGIILYFVMEEGGEGVSVYLAGWSPFPAQDSYSIKTRDYDLLATLSGYESDFELGLDKVDAEFFSMNEGIGPVRSPFPEQDKANMRAAMSSWPSGYFLAFAAKTERNIVAVLPEDVMNRIQQGGSIKPRMDLAIQLIKELAETDVKFGWIALRPTLPAHFFGRERL